MHVEMTGGSAPLFGPERAEPADVGKLLGDGLRKVNDMQVKADELTQAFAAGQDVDVHRVMLAAQEAQLAMQFAVQVRNKLVDAYQELMRMQI